MMIGKLVALIEDHADEHLGILHIIQRKACSEEDVVIDTGNDNCLRLIPVVGCEEETLQGNGSLCLVGGRDRDCHVRRRSRRKLDSEFCGASFLGR